MKRTLTNSARGSAGLPPGASTTNLLHCKPDYEAIKAALQSGRDLRVIDFAPETRPELLGTLARLCDEMPIRTSWQTLRERRLSETRLRVRRPAMYKKISIAVWVWMYRLAELREAHALKRNLWRQVWCCMGLVILCIFGGR